GGSRDTHGMLAACAAAASRAAYCSGGGVLRCTSRGLATSGANRRKGPTTGCLTLLAIRAAPPKRGTNRAAAQYAGQYGKMRVKRLASSVGATNGRPGGGMKRGSAYTRMKTRPMTSRPETRPSSVSITNPTLALEVWSDQGQNEARRALPALCATPN